MPVMLDVRAELDQEALAVLAARIRNTIREAVLNGIRDGLGDIGAMQIDDIAKATEHHPDQPR